MQMNHIEVVKDEDDIYLTQLNQFEEATIILHKSQVELVCKWMIELAKEV